MSIASASVLNNKKRYILHILSSRDTFVNLPTGFGKSLIFELTPLCFDCQRNVPLGSLKVLIIYIASYLADGVTNWRSGQKAARLSDGTEASVSLTEASYLFCHPESLQEKKWVATIRKDEF